MSKQLQWDQTGERQFEAGVSKGVLYVRDTTGAYPKGVAWNGLTNVSESPSGAEPSPHYADNIKYLNIMSTEEFNGTIEAFMYPEEFEACNGSPTAVDGMRIGQQRRKTFGFSYRTEIGNDIDELDLGYKIHIVYGALASPSEKAYGSVGESVEPVPFSWAISTTPVPVPNFKPTSTITFSSLENDVAVMKLVEKTLYGDGESEAKLPLPEEWITLLATVAPQG